MYLFSSFSIISVSHQIASPRPFFKSRMVALLQELLTKLYKDLDEEEEKLSQLTPDVECEKRVFAELYRSSDRGKSRVRIVGPVGERPVHVLLLRAGTFDKEIRTGIIEGVK